MISETVKPTTLDNVELVAQALKGKTAPEFVAGYLANFAEIIADNPRQYRAYGPYWWAIKSLMVEHGIMDFGEEIEAGTIEHYSYPSDVDTIVSAWSYFQDVFSDGRLYSSEHQLPMADGELYLYELIDMEMEALIIG